MLCKRAHQAKGEIDTEPVEYKKGRVVLIQEAPFGDLTKPVQALVVKLVQQLDVRFFSNWLMQDEAFKELHDALELKTGNPKGNCKVFTPLCLAAMLLDPPMYVVFTKRLFNKKDGKSLLEKLYVGDYSFDIAKNVVAGLMGLEVPMTTAVKRKNNEKNAQVNAKKKVKSDPYKSMDDSFGVANLSDSDDEDEVDQSDVEETPVGLQYPPELTCYLNYLDGKGLPLKKARQWIKEEPNSQHRMYKYWFGELKKRSYGDKLPRLGLLLATMPATSAGVERTASKCSIIDDKRRHNIRPSVFEILTLLADNKEMVTQLHPDKVKKESKKSATDILKHGSSYCRPNCNKEVSVVEECDLVNEDNVEDDLELDHDGSDPKALEQLVASPASSSTRKKSEVVRTPVVSALRLARAIEDDDSNSDVDELAFLTEMFDFSDCPDEEDKSSDDNEEPEVITFSENNPFKLKRLRREVKKPKHLNIYECEAP